MLESIRKTLLTGLGAAVVTKDKVQASLEELVRQGKMSADDARDTAEKIVKQGRQEFEDASGHLHRKVTDVINHSDRKAHARIEELEARIRALERKPGSAKPAAAAAKPHVKAKAAKPTRPKTKS